MREFFNLTIKTANDLVMLSNTLGKVFRKSFSKIVRTKRQTYGGFTSSDWEKVGNDMKRGLISFGKAR